MKIEIKISPHCLLSENSNFLSFLMGCLSAVYNSSVGQFDVTLSFTSQSKSNSDGM